MRKIGYIYLLLVIAIVVLFILNITCGAVSIPLNEIIDIIRGYDSDPMTQTIILESRLPQAATATLSGAALAASGLVLQTLFRNPLASPSILGISSGSGLGVAIVIMALGGRVGSLALSGSLAVVAGAFVGAMVVLLLLLLFTTFIEGSVMLLVVGLMMSYITSSVSSLLSFYSSSDNVMSYVVWGMGNFTGVTSDTLPIFSVLIVMAIAISILMIKPLNAMLIGDRYSSNLGVNIRATRFGVLTTAGILTAIVTAYCGPIGFIGMATPHLSRMTIGTTDHRRLLPVTILMGSVISLCCNLLSTSLLGGKIIPLNVITPLMGAPVIIYIITRKNRMSYFS